MNVKRVGEGTVVLIAGGGRVYTDVAARFTRSERSLTEILASPYNEKLVRTIVDKGHLAATEFDYFLFGVEGYSRVTEVQLVRKRMANYLIKSGRVDKHGKRAFDVVVPNGVLEHTAACTLADGTALTLSGEDLLRLTEQWYNAGVAQGMPEEDLRYLKPQATEFKAIIGMNAHALLDWFKIRCCKNAQAEIRDMACSACARRPRPTCSAMRARRAWRSATARRTTFRTRRAMWCARIARSNCCGRQRRERGSGGRARAAARLLRALFDCVCGQPARRRVRAHGVLV